MPLDYLQSDNIAVQRLNASHDPAVSIIRTAFFAAEYAFFRKHIRNSNVLVAGAGLGHDSVELAAYNHSVVGIELHPELVRRATRQCNHEQRGNVTFVQGDMRKTTFTDQSFDAAVLNMGTIGNL